MYATQSISVYATFLTIKQLSANSRRKIVPITRDGEGGGRFKDHWGGDDFVMEEEGSEEGDFEGAEERERRRERVVAIL